MVQIGHKKQQFYSKTINQLHFLTKSCIRNNIFNLLHFVLGKKKNLKNTQLEMCKIINNKKNSYYILNYYNFKLLFCYRKNALKINTKKLKQKNSSQIFEKI